MSAHCTRLVLFCLLAGLSTHFSTAQSRLLSEAELDTVKHWYPQPTMLNIDFRMPLAMYAGFKDLAQQVKAGKKIYAVEINDGSFSTSDIAYLKQCPDLQLISVSVRNESFLDSLVDAIADLPVQRLRLIWYPPFRQLPQPEKKDLHLPATISRLKFLNQIILSGPSFDWPDCFKKLATVASLRKLQLTGFYNYGTGAMPPVKIAGLQELRQLTHLTLDISKAVQLTPALGELSQLRTLVINAIDRPFADTTQVITHALAKLINLEKLTIPVSYLGDGTTLDRLVKLQTIKLVGVIGNEDNRSVKLPDFARFPDLEVLDLSLLQLKEWPDGVCQLTHLKELIVSGNQFSGIPPCLENLKSLEVLDLYSNPIRVVPEWVGSLSNLERLRIAFCRLDTLPDLFANLRRLTNLDCSNNSLKALPASICQLQHLQLLNATANKLQALPGNFGNLRELTTLNLSTNQLTTVPTAIGELMRLKQLMVSNNKLTKLPDELGKLRHLRQLIADNNQLITLPESLIRLDSLQTLTLSNNQLTTLPAELGRLRQLSLLSLQNNQLTRLPDGISKLTELRYLELTENPLQELPSTIGEMHQLERLQITKTKIRFLPATIGNLTKLRDVYLADNELMALPDEIGRWENVRNIVVNGNRLTGLPNAIGRLKKLQSLSISSRPNEPYSIQQLPDSIVHCTSLQTVMITNQAELEADDAFQKLAQLPTLQNLTLTNCRLSHWPTIDWKKTSVSRLQLTQNALTNVPTALLDAPKLIMIDLRENPLPKPLDAMFGSKDQLRIALAEIGQISLESSAKPNWSVANGFMQSSRRKSMQRDWNGTLDDLSKAIEYAPDSMASIVYAQRAEFQFFRKNFSESIADFDKALTYWPKLTNSLSGAGGLGRGQETKNRLRATWWTRKAMARGNLAQYEAALKDADQAAQFLPALSATPNREDAQATGMIHIERGRFQLLTNHRKEMLESFGKAMDAYEKITYAEPGTQLTVVELGIISQQYDRASKALDKLPEYQRREGFATLSEYLKTCLAVLKEEQKPEQATETMQTYIRNHGSQITGWSFDLFDAWLNGADLLPAKIEALKQLTTTVKERLVKME